MQVRRIGLLVFCSLYMAGCDNSKSADSVSSQSTNADSCSTQAQALTQSRIVPNRFIVHWEDGHVSVEASENLALFKKRFVQANLQNIHHVENDQVITMQSVHVDASSIVTGNAPTWGPDLIQASTAWTKGATGQGISVAVVDAAVDYSHPQLKNQLAANTAEVNGQPGIDDDGNGYVDDFYGWDFDGNTNDPKALVSTTNDHGTHVSGIIAADHTSGPVQGVAPSAKIIPVNFMGSDGSGSLGLAIQAMQYAVSRGAKVINASWGGSQCSQTLKNVVTGLSDKNVLFVVAAGNDGVDLDSNPDYPANFNISNQITVGASNSNDYLDTWSNYSYSLVHLSAPGDTIFSTVPGATQAYMSGTSMAAPFVSGAAAALWSLRPNATPTQIKQALLAGVDKRSLATVSGGRLNLAASVQALLSALP